MIATAAMAWAEAYAACQDCGTTEQQHHARGLCYRCYMRAANAKWRDEHRVAFNDYHRVYKAEWITRPSFEATLGPTDAGAANFRRLGLRCCSEADYALWHAAAKRSGEPYDDLKDFCRECMLIVQMEMTEQGRCRKADPA